MLNAHTAVELIFQGQRLLQLPDIALADASSRFLERMGYRVFEIELTLPNGPRTLAQGNALRAYAAHLVKALDAHCPADVLTFQGVQLSGTFDTVRARYFLNDHLHVLPAPALRKLVQFIVTAAEHSLAMLANPEVACGLPGAVYTRRGLPLTLHAPQSRWTPATEQWCVIGDDNETDESGVLEQCINEFDARETVRFMARLPARFSQVQATTWGALQQAAVAQKTQVPA